MVRNGADDSDTTYAPYCRLDTAMGCVGCIPPEVHCPKLTWESVQTRRSRALCRYCSYWPDGSFCFESRVRVVPGMLDNAAGHFYYFALLRHRTMNQHADASRY